MAKTLGQVLYESGEVGISWYFMSDAPRLGYEEKAQAVAEAVRAQCIAALEAQEARIKELEAEAEGYKQQNLDRRQVIATLLAASSPISLPEPVTSVGGTTTASIVDCPHCRRVLHIEWPVWSKPLEVHFGLLPDPALPTFDDNGKQIGGFYSKEQVLQLIDQALKGKP